MPVDLVRGTTNADMLIPKSFRRWEPGAVNRKTAPPATLLAVEFGRSPGSQVRYTFG